ncbi:uncharacterized protein LOC116185395 [Apis dorsata]|uniref:uncharacterized protein LOC116185395 n=1 Tax=Apis dorsata TaxID=7462 RepID=UPI00129314A2|nr:uncharacterized protein LOC116185395 [Apis dorsata]
MEQQLLTMCISTLKDFINFIIHGQVNYLMIKRHKTNYTIIIHYLQPIKCEFNINIVVSSKQLIFSPNFEDFKNILCNILNEICIGVRFFKKLETELYVDWSGEEGFLEV